MEGVKNYMEEWVEEYTEKLICEFQMCTCNKCKRDIYAIALNRLKPYYIVTSKGRVMVKLNLMRQQFEADIIAAVIQAIQIVKDTPKHE